MPTYLTATLYAPLASFGGLAVGERRASERYPTRSMLIGLLAAALGIDRGDEQAQHALANGYHFAVQIFARGQPFTDYHTAQMPSRGKTRFGTRRNELAATELNTVLTSRDYMGDFLAGMAVSALATAPYSLEDVAASLRAPRFTLSFGRKSCPFGLPLAPRVAVYKDIRAALATTMESPGMAERLAPLRARPGEIVSDLAMAPSGESGRTEFLRDQPLSRTRWQFGLRPVAILNAEAPSA